MFCEETALALRVPWASHYFRRLELCGRNPDSRLTSIETTKNRQHFEACDVSHQCKALHVRDVTSMETLSRVRVADDMV